MMNSIQELRLLTKSVKEKKAPAGAFAYDEDFDEEAFDKEFADAIPSEDGDGFVDILEEDLEDFDLEDDAMK